MKTLFTIAALLLLTCAPALAQSYDGPSKGDLRRYTVTQNPAVPFRLFPTQNSWNFMKLDTRTGQIWMVQYSVGKEDNSFTWAVDARMIEQPTDANIGRFTLYPTNNWYNYILLDQYDGRTWQVQFSIDEPEKNFRMRIY